MTTFDLTSLISLDNIEKNENKEITIKKSEKNATNTSGKQENLNTSKNNSKTKGGENGNIH